MPHVTANFTMSALPPSFVDSPQSFANAIAAGLVADLDLDALVVTGQVGGTEPVTNIGLWFPPVTGSTTSPSGIVYAWNADSAKYLPAPLVAGQLVGNSLFITQLQATSTADRIQKLPDKDGTIALLSDISTGTGTKTYTGGAVTLNWEDRKTAYITLTGDCTITLSGVPTDDQWLDIWLENNGGNLFTVTYAGTIIWPAATPPVQTTNADATKRVIDHIRLYNIGALGGTLYGEAVKQNYIISTTADTVKPTLVTVTRYGNTITATFDEPLIGEGLNTAGFQIRTPMAGTIQSITSATAAGTIVTILMAASMPAASQYTFQYTGTDISDLTLNLADPIAETIMDYVNVIGTQGGTIGVTGGHNVP